MFPPYLKIDTFSATTKDQIKKELKKFNKNVNSIVIDLRDNTGGYLDTAYDVSNLFLPHLKHFIILPLFENSLIKIFSILCPFLHSISN